MDDTLPPHIRETLARQWSGEGSADDNALIDAWLAGHPDRPARVDRLRMVWDAHVATSMPVNVERAAATILGAITVPVNPDVAGTGPVTPGSRRIPKGAVPLKSQRRWPAALVGSAFALVLAAVWNWQSLVTSRPDAPSADGYRTARGQRTTISLPDGSTLVLAPESQARVEFSDTQRSIVLDGQAYLTVVPNSRAPFAVTTSDGPVRVLGTRFVVRRYASESYTQVAVLDGRVGVRQAVLAPGDIAIASTDGITITRDTDTARAMGWLHGRLVFQDTPLRDVLAELGRWYDVEFVLNDQAAGATRISTTVSDTVFTDATMQSLAFLIHAHAERHGRTITFKVGS